VIFNTADDQRGAFPLFEYASLVCEVGHTMQMVGSLCPRETQHRRAHTSVRGTASRIRDGWINREISVADRSAISSLKARPATAGLTTARTGTTCTDAGRHPQDSAQIEERIRGCRSNFRRNGLFNRTESVSRSSLSTESASQFRWLPWLAGSRRRPESIPCRLSMPPAIHHPISLQRTAAVVGSARAVQSIPSARVLR
jgi:hypothetical protein